MFGKKKKPAPKKNPSNIKHIVAVASGKGGVGKSTTSMNLAVALSVQGHKVGLLDADVYGPSQPRMMGVKDQRPESNGEVIQPVLAHGVKLMSMGFLMEEEAPIVWRGPLVQSALMQMINNVNWGALDVLVIDMPPGTGDTQLTMTQQLALSGAVIVSTPQDISLIDARKGLEMFKKVNVPILGMVENMSMFCCPKCGHQTPIFSHGGARQEAEKVGVDFLAEIPLDPQIREKTDDGKSVLVTMPDSPQAQSYRDLAEQVWQKLEFQQKDLAGQQVKIVIE